MNPRDAFAARIRSLRKALKEDLATFGARFCRAARTIEDWEQRRRDPDPLVLRELAATEARVSTESRQRRVSQKP